MATKTAGAREIILRLNSLGVGDLDQLRSRLESVGDDLTALGQDELRSRLEKGIEALEAGRTADYRKQISHIVSRLGHLR